MALVNCDDYAYAAAETISVPVFSAHGDALVLFVSVNSELVRGAKGYCKCYALNYHVQCASADGIRLLCEEW